MTNFFFFFWFTYLATLQIIFLAVFKQFEICKIASVKISIHIVRKLQKKKNPKPNSFFFTVHKQAQVVRFDFGQTQEFHIQFPRPPEKWMSYIPEFSFSVFGKLWKDFLTTWDVSDIRLFFLLHLGRRSPKFSFDHRQSPRASGGLSSQRLTEGGGGVKFN